MHAKTILHLPQHSISSDIHKKKSLMEISNF